MLKLHNYQNKTMSDIQYCLNLPTNRKKTLNTLLAKEVLMQLIKDFQYKNHSPFIFDLILCTGEGELSSTFEFYKHLTLNDYARPIFFQNSLHNSTLGALSLEANGIESGMSISNGSLSFENGIDCALCRPSEKPIIVLGVDSYPKELLEMKSKSYGQNVQLINGACGAIFTRANAEDKGIIIKKIEYTFNDFNKKHNDDFINFYPSNGILDFLKYYKPNLSSFCIQKPNNTKVKYFLHHDVN